MTDPTPTPEPLRATPEQWSDVGAFARDTRACILELRDRVQALEAERETTRLAFQAWGKDVGRLQDAVNQQVQALEASVESIGNGLMEVQAKLMTPEEVDMIMAPMSLCIPSPDNDDPQTLHTIALKHVGTLRRMGILPEICSDLERAILQPMEATPAEPTPPAGPDFSNGLRAAVKDAIKDAAADWDAEAAACLRVIAAWLRQRHGGSSTTAELLDAEADRP